MVVGINDVRFLDGGNSSNEGLQFVTGRSYKGGFEKYVCLEDKKL